MYTTRRLQTKELVNEEKEMIGLIPMTQAPPPVENSKKQSD